MKQLEAQKNPSKVLLKRQNRAEFFLIIGEVSAVAAIKGLFLKNRP